MIIRGEKKKSRKNSEKNTKKKKNKKKRKKNKNMYICKIVGTVGNLSTEKFKLGNCPSTVGK
jgi:hypothetical protein